MANVRPAELVTGETSRRPSGVADNSRGDEVRSTPVISNPPFSSELYQKLENPLKHLLKNLPIVDGNEVEQLCDFLLQALNIRRVAQVAVPMIYEILLPYCRGELLVALQHAMCIRENFDLFHERVLRQFISARSLYQLRGRKYERVQRLHEPLSAYVQSIREAAAVLRILETEQQTVARIVDGLTPTQRARFVFQQLPTTFEQLEQLAVVDRNVTHAEHQREPMSGEVNSGRQSTKKMADNSSQPTVRRSFATGNQRLCYGVLNLDISRNNVRPGHPPDTNWDS
jgi:hypothetical protein